MNKKLICCPFALLDGYNGSANQNKTKESLYIYLKNAAVSCFSAKVHNPNVDVGFVHNLKTIPQEFSLFFKKNDILTIYVEFDDFRFPPDYKWSLAFYKLCVMNYMAYNSDYNSIIILDTDTCVIGNVDSIWKICENRLMLYNVQHSLDLDAYQSRIEEYRKLYPNNLYPTVWGGEFIGASKAILKSFVEECKKVYQKLKVENFYTQFGDEFITFCAAENYSGKIIDAAPYVRRYWTTNIYYQCFTDHELLLKILHIPNEKNDGFIRIYNYITKHNSLPNNKKIFRIMGLPKCQRPVYYENMIYFVFRKIKRLIRTLQGEKSEK